MEVLGDRSGHRVEEHIDAHACSEEHGDPGEEVVLRAGMVGPQADRTLLGERNPEHEADDHGDGDDVEPAEILCDPVHGRLHGRLSRVGHHHRPHGERENDEGGDDEYSPVDPGAAFVGKLLRAFAHLRAVDRSALLRVDIPADSGCPVGAAESFPFDDWALQLLFIRILHASTSSRQNGTGPEIGPDLLYGWRILTNSSPPTFR